MFQVVFFVNVDNLCLRKLYFQVFSSKTLISFIFGKRKAQYGKFNCHDRQSLYLEPFLMPMTHI